MYRSFERQPEDEDESSEKAEKGTKEKRQINATISVEDDDCIIVETTNNDEPPNKKPRWSLFDLFSRTRPVNPLGTRSNQSYVTPYSIPIHATPTRGPVFGRGTAMAPLYTSAGFSFSKHSGYPVYTSHTVQSFRSDAGAQSGGSSATPSARSSPPSGATSAESNAASSVTALVDESIHRLHSETTDSTNTATTTTNDKIMDILDRMHNMELSNSHIISNYNNYIQEKRTTYVETVEGIEEDKIRTKCRLATRDEVEERRRKQLALKGLFFKPKPKPKNEFPELPSEAEHIYKEAWKRHLPQDEVFSEGFSIKLARKDLLTLSGNEWLNDEVINFFLNLIVERAEKDKTYPKTYMFNSFFYATLASRGYGGVKRWTRKVDIFSYEIILVPIHLTVHWCMAVIDFGQKRIEYYDSLLHQDNEVVFRLRNYLQEECLDKKKVDFDFTDWECYQRLDIPRQTNGSDCGVFATRFAEFASRRADIVFDQQHMQYYRRRMCFEVCTKKLM